MANAVESGLIQVLVRTLYTFPQICVACLQIQFYDTSNSFKTQKFCFDSEAESCGG